MGFMDNLAQAAAGLFGGASPQQTADAASAHVENTDPNELADHLTQSVGTMDQSNVASLGKQLLESFTNHGSFAGDGNAAAQQAGVTQDAVASGQPGAVGALLQFAKSNPAVLQTAASAFMQRNPGAIGQLAPQLLQGIMGRL